MIFIAFRKLVKKKKTWKLRPHVPQGIKKHNENKLFSCLFLKILILFEKKQNYIKENDSETNYNKKKNLS